MVKTLSLHEQLTYSTARIECARRGRNVSTGTGFFCRLLHRDGRYAPVLVTSRHVVAGAQRGRLHLMLANPAARPPLQAHTIILDDFQARWLPHPETAVDLCIMPIAELAVDLQQRTGLALQMLSSDFIPTPFEHAELTAFEDVVVVGYPNGVWDSVNHRPIVRRGITATDPDVEYIGRPEFLIDRPWLPGTSGAPVLLWNIGSYVTRAGELIGRSRVKLLGILYGSSGRRTPGGVDLMGDPVEYEATALTPTSFELGAVVKARKLLEFEPILEALAARGQQRWAW